MDTTLPARELTAGQLRTVGERSEQLATTFLDSLDEAALSTEMVCHFAEGGRSPEARFAIGDVLWHMVEAELQHRGEINSLFWQLDIDPPIATVGDCNASEGGAAEANVQSISVRRSVAAECPEAFPWFRNPAVRSEPDGTLQPQLLREAGEVLGPRRKPWIRQSDGFYEERVTGPPGFEPGFEAPEASVISKLYYEPATDDGQPSRARLLTFRPSARDLRARLVAGRTSAAHRGAGASVGSGRVQAFLARLSGHR